MDLATTKAYALPGNLTSGIQHGSWSMPLDAGKAPKPNLLNSNSQDVFEDLKYSEEDIKHIEEWVKRHVETTWHSLGVCPPSTPSIFFHTLTGPRHAQWHPRKATAS